MVANIMSSPSIRLLAGENPGLLCSLQTHSVVGVTLSPFAETAQGLLGLNRLGVSLSFSFSFSFLFFFFFGFF
jgi:hypothetical protein